MHQIQNILSKRQSNLLCINSVVLILLYFTLFLVREKKLQGQYRGPGRPRKEHIKCSRGRGRPPKKDQNGKVKDSPYQVVPKATGTT